MTLDPENLDHALKALPTRPLDPHVDAAALRAARGVFLAREGEPVGLWATCVLVWERALAPLLVTATVGSYLVWAVQSAQSLYSH
jgi:hypothetical protein